MVTDLVCKLLYHQDKGPVTDGFSFFDSVQICNHIVVLGIRKRKPHICNIAFICSGKKGERRIAYIDKMTNRVKA